MTHKQSLATSHTLEVSHGMMRSFGVVTLLILALVTLTTLPTHVAAVENEITFTPIFDASFVDTDAPIVCHSAADCSGNGVCKSGVCMCIQPWTGPSCSRKSCPNQCSGTGRCDTMTGQCHCYNATELARIYPTDGPDHEWGFEGDDCSRKTCFSDCGVKNGFGECNKDTGLCECKKGFWGPEGMHCNSVLCDDNCSNHGFCVDNHCLCDIAANRMSGWTGEKCEKPVCPNHCMESVGLGKCVDAKCECTEGWYGEDCSKKMCPVNYSPLAWIGAKKVMCSGFGECDNGVCKCVEGFTGEDCSIRVCPGMSFHGTSTNVSCSGHGTCQFNGLCLCDPGYTGEDCFERTCPTDCGAQHGYGSCNGETGQCECEEDRYGADCSFLICDDSCNGNGRCLDDRCVCKPGFQGPHCEQVVCAHNCSYAEGQGECVNGKCVCAPGFYGVECLYPECPRTMNPITRVPDLICGGNGVCTEGKCVCNAAWKGADCTVRACPYNCSDVGICGPDGTCTCPEGGPDGRGGFTGKFCEVTICPSNCGEDKGLGKCVDSECVCKPGQGQPDCLYDACPLGLPPLASAFTKPLPCSGTGTCVKGACVCQPGWTGKACSDRPCLNDCNDNGICQSNGLCKCHDRFNGSDCATEGCPSGCSGHGSCMGDDICKCDPRWTGERCEIAKCPNGCSGNGECVRRLATDELPATELCLCDPGYQGADCSQPICEPISADGKMCKGKGRCVVTHNGRHVCRCDSPFAGAECGNLACNATCSYHGVCTGSNVPHEKCECDEGWFGENCDRTGNCEPFDCYGRGKCVAGLKGAPTCQCKAPFGGPDCSLCTHNCNGHGTCTPNGCVCVDGWQGPLCDRREDCDPKDCGGPSHGTCVADADGLPVCKCKFPWTDFDCLQCTLTCNEHGECNEQGKCTCDKGWKGENCERYGDCPNDCSGKGTCIADDIGDPVCKCEPGYAGRDCGNIVCNKKCPKNSRCLDDECVCEEGWTGDFCDERNDCPDNCSGLGTCMADLQGKPFCKCQIGRGGPACQFQSCSKTCSDHGSCFIEKGEQKCLCEPGFGGAECEKQDCSAWASCGGPKHGTCGQDERGMPKCLCLHPYTGTNCTDVLCSPDACKHGTCVNAKCQCEAGWKGPKCDYRVPCPAPGCGEAGRCIGDEKGVGKCECNPGFTGPNCLDVICTDKCSGHGKCVNQACVCDPGFHGEKCEITAPCPNNCNGHGQCNYDEKAKKSVCDCEDMWDSGDGKGDCSVQRGKTWIDSSGRLQYKCAPPYFGNLCQSKGCLKPCQNGGKCALDGACDCPPGFKGVDCSETVCPKGCSGGGQCDLKAKQCRCFFGYSGPACENFNQDICQSTCSFKCSLVGANGLISVSDKDHNKRWVASRDCHKMCRLPGMCAVMFGTGHPNSNNKVTGDLVTIAKK